MPVEFSAGGAGRGGSHTVSSGRAESKGLRGDANNKTLPKGEKGPAPGSPQAYDYQDAF